MYYVLRGVALLTLLCGPLLASAASFSVVPPYGTYSVGDTIPVQVLLTSDDASTNYISGALKIPPHSFSIQSVSKNGSIVSHWVSDPDISKNDGIVSFEGLFSPAYRGTDGLVLTLLLKVLNNGPASMTFIRGQILKNDGNATDLTSALNGATYTIGSVSASPAVTETVLSHTLSNIDPNTAGYFLTLLLLPLAILIVIVALLLVTRNNLGKKNFFKKKQRSVYRTAKKLLFSFIDFLDSSVKELHVPSKKRALVATEKKLIRKTKRKLHISKKNTKMVKKKLKKYISDAARG